MEIETGFSAIGSNDIQEQVMTHNIDALVGHIELGNQIEKLEAVAELCRVARIDQRFLPRLAACAQMHCASELLRASLVVVIGKIRPLDKQVAGLLVDHLTFDPSAEVRLAALQGIVHIEDGPQSVIQSLCLCIAGDRFVSVRCEALYVLSEIGSLTPLVSKTLFEAERNSAGLLRMLVALTSSLLSFRERERQQVGFVKYDRP